jgi:pimeloyl-ACP methyl ester carboxylesterase
VPAGHSFGGLYVLSFAARYPDEVAACTVSSRAPPKASLISDEEDSAATTQAILDVVSSVRSAGSLVR